MLDNLRPLPVQKILDIGSGSGWTTALLAYIVGSQGDIVSIERIQAIADIGKENIDRYNYITQ
jgi:protein-L-isoaspartate(D-aspartate) O-methyltransferase